MTQSMLLIAKDESVRKAYLDKLFQEKGIGKFDQTVIAPEENSLGIKEVRDARKNAYLRPIQGSKKALIFENAQLLTIDAQNALLKLLEEPPTQTIIFLSATTDSTFLPTILSRCKVIVLEKSNEKASEEERALLKKHMQILTKGSIGEKLSLAETLATKKDDLEKWLEQSLILLRDAMLADPQNIVYPILLVKLQEARQLFQTTNVSPRVILEHTFLTIHQ